MHAIELGFNKLNSPCHYGVMRAWMKALFSVLLYQQPKYRKRKGIIPHPQSLPKVDPLDALSAQPVELISQLISERFDGIYSRSRHQHDIK